MLDTKLHFSSYTNIVLMFQIIEGYKMMNNAWAYDRIKNGRR